MPTPVGTDGRKYRELRIVNIVASGTLGAGEIDTDALATDLDVVKTSLPGRLYLTKNADAPIAMVYRSGSFSIAGATSWQGVRDTVEWLSGVLEDIGFNVDGEAVHTSLEVKYIVVTAELGSSTNLAAAAIALGMENTEYEPEQFPALIYRPEDADCTVMVFSNGKLTITGVREVETAYRVFRNVRTILTEKLNT